MGLPLVKLAVGFADPQGGTNRRKQVQPTVRPEGRTIAVSLSGKTHLPRPSQVRFLGNAKGADKTKANNAREGVEFDHDRRGANPPRIKWTSKARLKGLAIPKGPAVGCDLVVIVISGDDCRLRASKASQATAFFAKQHR